jgi:hypothetical protein
MKMLGAQTAVLDALMIVYAGTCEVFPTFYFLWN